MEKDRTKEEVKTQTDRPSDHEKKRKSKEKSKPGGEQENELFFGEKKFRTGLGLFTILFMILSFTFETTVSEEEARAEVMNRTSGIIESGFTTDADIALEPRDFEVTGFDGGTARMLIWDYKGDTNNEVQILVDGQPIREVHILNSNVAAYSVPVPSVVTIQGLKSEGAQPITYAVKFPDRKQTLFNTVSTNGANQFTLVPRF